MTLSVPDQTKTVIRPARDRDWEAIEALAGRSGEVSAARGPRRGRGWPGWARLLPDWARQTPRAHVLEIDQRVVGAIEVSPFNSSRSTWRVERVLAETGAPLSRMEIGSRLLRYCFEKIWEARTWILEVDIHDQSALGLYRRNGFQPLAQLTYWSLPPEVLEGLAREEPDLPNLLPVSNADAQLLYQLDTVSMPPLLRQVFDRHIPDFKRGLLDALLESASRWWNQIEVPRGYVFEPQRKAAIGYFRLELHRGGDRSHRADLTVHPAYTWLYPELLSQMARLVRARAPRALRLASADYQPEREEYLEQIGAERVEHTLLMSRSVWHKLREAKQNSLERWQLSEVLGGLQPGGAPVPGRMSWSPHAQTDAGDANRSQPSRPSGEDRGASGSPERGDDGCSS